MFVSKKYIKFSFQHLGNGRENENGRIDRQLLVLKIKKNSILEKYIGKFLSLI